jgi:group I intron endonuclease
VSHVYLIVNHATNKVYVGKTVRSNLRAYLNRKIADALNQSNEKTRNGCPHLFNSIRKHGPMQFKIYALTDSIEDNRNLCKLEQIFIKAFNSRNPQIGYNITSGGDGAQPGEGNMFFGKKHSEATRKRLRQMAQHRVFSEERRNNHRLASLRRGAKPPSPLGSKQSEETIQKRLKSREGWKHTEETKQRLRDNHQRSWLGRKHSPETIAKMRQAQLDRRAREEAAGMDRSRKWGGN